MVLKIMVKTKTTIEGETYDDYSSKLDMPGSADFDVFVDNGGLTISAINEVADGTKKRDISVEIIFDRAISQKIAAACKDLPHLPE